MPQKSTYFFPEAVVGLPAQPAVGRLRADWLEFCEGVAETWTPCCGDCPPVTTASRWSAAASAGTTPQSSTRRPSPAVVRRLEALAGRGISFRLVSEELGERSYGDGDSRWRVVVDPIDGSLNAKRGPALLLHLDSVRRRPRAVGRRVRLRPRLRQRRGVGGDARRGRDRERPPAGRRCDQDRLGVVDLEATERRPGGRGRPRLDGSVGPHPRARRAGARVSASWPTGAGRRGLLKPSRSVDVAAATLIVREAGAHIDTRGPAAMPLDLSTARTQWWRRRDQPMGGSLSALLWG
jgi:hypothetical protein